jgi:hypothetical protein
MEQNELSKTIRKTILFSIAKSAGIAALCSLILTFNELRGNSNYLEDNQESAGIYFFELILLFFLCLLSMPALFLSQQHFYGSPVFSYLFYLIPLITFMFLWLFAKQTHDGITDIPLYPSVPYLLCWAYFHSALRAKMEVWKKEFIAKGNTNHF